MNKKYTKQEINDIILSKNLDEFYFAILERRDDINKDEYFDKSDYKVQGDVIATDLLNDDFFDTLAYYIAKVYYGLYNPKRFTILTMIDNDIYNINDPLEKIDLSKERIVRYDNITKFYDETNARFKLEKEGVVLLETDKEIEYKEYEDKDGLGDLTTDFIIEVKGRPYTKR